MRGAPSERMLLIPVAVALMLATTLGEISAHEHRVTRHADYETMPRLGNDGISDLVVYTRRALLPSGAFDQGDIWYQRLRADGTPAGSPVRVTSGTTDDQLNDISGDYIVYTAFESRLSLSGRFMLYQISTGSFQTLGEALICQEARVHGTHVVWREGGTSAATIWMYDLAWLGTSKKPFVLAGPSPTTFSVDIGDRFVVWFEQEGGQFDVIAFDLIEGRRVKVTNTSTTLEWEPSTSGPWIVWQAKDPGVYGSRIEALNMDTGERRVVIDDGVSYYRPSIDGDLIAYESRSVPAGNLDIYFYRLSEGDTFRVTSHPAGQYLNDVFGHLVAYVDWRSGNEDVYVCDLSPFIPTPNEVQITHDPGVQMYPSISGHRIVWEDRRDSTYGIYMYDLSTGTERPICAHPAEQLYPSISGDRIVWQDRRNGNWDIYMYDLSTGTERPICARPAEQMHPSISGNRIVWQDTRKGNWDIYMYDLSTGTERPICRQAAEQWYPSISGDRIVWQDRRKGNWDIYMYDLSTGTERPICRQVAHQWYPTISGHRIVWEDWRDSTYGIYMYDLSTGTETPICARPAVRGRPKISGYKIVWQDKRHCNWDIYMYELPAPVAEAGTDQSVHAGTRVNLDGSGSSDPDGNYPLSYSWRITSKPTGSGAILSDQTVINPSFTADLPGDYTMELVVINSLGWSSEADSVHVSTSNTPPVAAAGPDQFIFQLGAKVQLDGTLSYDDDGDPITYSWAITAKPPGSSATLSDPTSANPTFVVDMDGDYVIELVVSDPWSSGAPDTMTVYFLVH